MLKIGAFTESRLSRMSDAKLYAEITHGLLYGVQTTKRQQLDKMYLEFDDAFVDRNRYQRRFQEALSVIVAHDEIHSGALMKPHILYSLFLAITHAQTPAENLQNLVPRGRGVRINHDAAGLALTTLAEALTDEDVEARFGPFREACESRTNVKAQRESRVKWLSNALIGELGG